jgi:hypothetical protein
VDLDTVKFTLHTTVCDRRTGEETRPRVSSGYRNSPTSAVYGHENGPRALFLPRTSTILRCHLLLCCVLEVIMNCLH